MYVDGMSVPSSVFIKSIEDVINTNGDSFHQFNVRKGFCSALIEYRRIFPNYEIATVWTKNYIAKMLRLWYQCTGHNRIFKPITRWRERQSAVLHHWIINDWFLHICENSDDNGFSACTQNNCKNKPNINIGQFAPYDKLDFTGWWWWWFHRLLFVTIFDKIYSISEKIDHIYKEKIHSRSILDGCRWIFAAFTLLITKLCL